MTNTQRILLSISAWIIGIVAGYATAKIQTRIRS